MNTREILIQARSFIDTPEKWTKGHYALNANGKPVSEQGDEAVCFCTAGALNRAGDNGYVKQKLARLAEDRGYMGVANFNDANRTTHADVMALFDKAIANASVS